MKPLAPALSLAAPAAEHNTTPGMFGSRAAMIGGVLDLSTPDNRVAALDAATGREWWAFDPRAYVDGQVPNGTVFAHRGVARRQVRQTGRPISAVTAPPVD